jgi:hypothetical protein
VIGGLYGFHNWSGSRPYKVILNRRVLERTDWYGYNGDNYGRTTGLTAANKGEKIVKTINASYSQTNEIMFPVGNDPAYIDFVVCENEQQKKSLIDHLKGNGIHEFNGKPLDRFVRVETKFFKHPDDLNPTEAAGDAASRVANETARKVADEGSSRARSA